MGTGFPAAVDPEPLVGVGANGRFKSVLNALGINEGVAGYTDGSIELQDVLPFPGRPDGVAGEDGGPGAGGEFSEGGTDAGLAPKEIDEEPFIESDVLIDEDANGLVGSQGAEDGPDAVGFADNDVATSRAAGVDEGVQKRVIEGADDDVHGLGHEGMSIGGEFPVAEVEGSEEDPLAVGFGCFIMLETFITDPIVNIGLIDAREAGEADEEAADGAEDAVDDAGADAGDFAIPEGDAAEFGDGEIEDIGVEGAEETGGSEGDRGEEDADEPIFGEVAPVATQSTRLRGRGRRRKRRHLGRG